MSGHSHNHDCGHSHDPGHDHGHSHGAPADVRQLTQQLRDHAQKITGPRHAILNVLSEHQKPLTNKEIFAKLPEGMCDLATVYRSMHMLIKMGMVTRYDFGDGTARFELNCPECDSHHHHLVCNQCSKIIELEECFPSELEQALAAKHGFAKISHKLEFFGVCPDCQAGDKS